ncbi:PD-(D/E)XK nuclease family protein [uncultured Chryseobacterium sp.]|uniref:PD-(D/E)XK nuclease family protein n=1 Tax=uncultured Chryseobacterium sp. TaxID=259322 RepID=UPI0025FD7959|nr:PD-(D/E)XK nuclease family protein [uncultured Chryseobacterium sp.]
MQNDLSQLKKIFNTIPENPNLKSNNLFSIGTRGFYENPFTEVLSYLLKKNTGYKRRDEFMKILLADLKDEDFLNSLISNSEVSTQFITSNGKYIDLILYNENNILVFENKINHWMANPFDDYENHINLKFPLHNKRYVIFSYKKENCPDNWKYLSIRRIFDKIISAKLHVFDNKWDYFTHDFLLQFSNSKLIDMDQSYFDFMRKIFLR